MSWIQIPDACGTSAAWALEVLLSWLWDSVIQTAQKQCTLLFASGIRPPLKKGELRAILTACALNEQLVMALLTEGLI